MKLMGHRSVIYMLATTEVPAPSENRILIVYPAASPYNDWANLAFPVTPTVEMWTLVQAQVFPSVLSC